MKKTKSGPIKPTVLVILDGFGYSRHKKYNAVLQADPKNFLGWLKIYPHTTLKASGHAVGLHDNIMGNSEVGHLTIGAGKIIKEALTGILEAIKNKTFFENRELNHKLKSFAKTGKTMHLVGLLTDGQVHSHYKILYALIKLCKQNNIENIIIHPFLDGRDMPAKSALGLLKKLQNYLNRLKVGTIGSMIGRFYAMDRDRNYLRTKKTYTMLVDGKGNRFYNFNQAIKAYYKDTITDEFIPPTIFDPNSSIKKDDGIIFFNTRPDRIKQLIRSLVDPEFDKFKTKNLHLEIKISCYDFEKKLGLDPVYKRPKVTNTLLEILIKHKKRIFSIAETEKFAHITYFFNGGKRLKSNLVKEVLITSLNPKNFSKIPEMSAEKITDSILNSLLNEPRDFYLVNFANADMVGHSGNLQATIKAIKFLDKQLQRIYEQVVEKMNGTLFITGDHGKAEQMVDTRTGLPLTSHTTNPVYFLMINKNLKNKSIHIDINQLSQIKDVILKSMHITQ